MPDSPDAYDNMAALGAKVLYAGLTTDAKVKISKEDNEVLERMGGGDRETGARIILEKAHNMARGEGVDFSAGPGRRMPDGSIQLPNAAFARILEPKELEILRRLADQAPSVGVSANTPEPPSIIPAKGLLKAIGVVLNTADTRTFRLTEEENQLLMIIGAEAYRLNPPEPRFINRDKIYEMYLQIGKEEAAKMKKFAESNSIEDLAKKLPTSIAVHLGLKGEKLLGPNASLDKGGVAVDGDGYVADNSLVPGERELAKDRFASIADPGYDVSIMPFNPQPSTPEERAAFNTLHGLLDVKMPEEVARDPLEDGLRRAEGVYIRPVDTSAADGGSFQGVDPDQIASIIRNGTVYGVQMDGAQSGDAFQRSLEAIVDGPVNIEPGGPGAVRTPDAVLDGSPSFKLKNPGFGG